jgi:hypothetical protein
MRKKPQQRGIIPPSPEPGATHAAGHFFKEQA